MDNFSVPWDPIRASVRRSHAVTVRLLDRRSPEGGAAAPTPVRHRFAPSDRHFVDGDCLTTLVCASDSAGAAADVGGITLRSANRRLLAKRLARLRDSRRMEESTLNFRTGRSTALVP